MQLFSRKEDVELEPSTIVSPQSLKHYALRIKYVTDSLRTHSVLPVWPSNKHVVASAQTNNILSHLTYASINDRALDGVRVDTTYVQRLNIIWKRFNVFTQGCSRFK